MESSETFSKSLLMVRVSKTEQEKEEENSEFNIHSISKVPQYTQIMRK